MDVYLASTNPTSSKVTEGSLMRSQRTTTGRHALYLMAPVLLVAGSALAAPAGAATNYHVKVTCTVPKAQPERQLASNSCLNYLPDGTQTFNAKVTDGSGDPVDGVVVQWSDSNSTARFRATHARPTAAVSAQTSWSRPSLARGRRSLSPRRSVAPQGLAI
jgi:hypothetical protein